MPVFSLCSQALVFEDADMTCMCGCYLFVDLLLSYKYKQGCAKTTSVIELCNIYQL